MDTVKSDKIKNALRTIVERFGEESIVNPVKARALMMDLLPEPDYESERRIIVSALEENIGKIILESCSNNNSDTKITFTKCMNILVKKLWLAEKAAVFAVDTIFYALGVESPEIISVTDTKENTETVAILNKGDLDNESIKNGKIYDNLKKYKILGFKSFACCDDLNEITIPENITAIEAKSFYNCKNLKKVVLHSEIKKIGQRVFQGCDALETIDCNNKNTNYSSAQGLLTDKKQKALLRSINDKNSNCEIPNYVEYIDAYAFEKSNYQKITLPKNLKTIHPKAFMYCDNLQHFTIDMSNSSFITKDGVLHSKDRKTLVRFPSGYNDTNYYLEDSVLVIGNRAFSYAAKLSSITLTGSLRTIEERAFEHCEKLQMVMIPSAVREIGERAFQYCTSLYTVIIPRIITEISDFTFYNCTSLSHISIPINAIRIGHCAFYGCKSLKEVIVQKNIKFIGTDAFADCSPDFTVKIKDNDYVRQFCEIRGIPYESI